MKRILVAAIALATLCALGASADDFWWNPYGIRTKWWVVPTGVDLTATYSLPPISEGLKTLIFAKAGGGWEDRALFRDPDSGEPLAVSTLGENVPAYTWINFQWDIALTQGLVPGGFKAPGGYAADLLEAFVFYRGRFDKTMSYDGGTLAGDGTVLAFADWDQELYTGFMAGLSWNGLEKDAHGAQSGLYAEAAFEYAPSALNAELADFWRASAKTIGALPVFGEKDDTAGFQGYLTDFASVDWAEGDKIPVYVNQSFGGRILRDSLGTCVRGYPLTAYDTKFKAVNNLEFRVNMPSFVKKLFYPIAFAFVDAGYFADYDGATAAASWNGCLASAGAGLAISAFDLAQVSVVVAQPFAQTSDFWWAIKLFLHF